MFKIFVGQCLVEAYHQRKKKRRNPLKNREILVKQAACIVGVLGCVELTFRKLWFGGAWCPDYRLHQIPFRIFDANYIVQA